jgi:pimeloyl-ACP methyl ester carboxylesterase
MRLFQFPVRLTIVLVVLLGGPPCSLRSQVQTTAPDWQAQAVRKYPDLGIRGSALNQRFVAAVIERRKINPQFFAHPQWPMTLADELAAPANPAPPTSPTPAPLAPPPAAGLQPPATFSNPGTPAATQLPAQRFEYDAGNIPKGVGLESAKFRWWAPPNTQVRGVIVVLSGRGGDSRGSVGDAAWQALAVEQQFGLVGCCLVNPKDNLYTFQGDPNGSVSDLLNKAVNALLDQAGQKIRNPPLVLHGHSAGGNITQQYISRHADRVVGAVLLRATGGPGGLANGKEDVPILICVGQKDKPEWVADSLASYERGHLLRADWTLALNPREGHEEGKTKPLAIAYLGAAIKLRLPATTPGGGFSSGNANAAKPLRLDKQSGWLGDPVTYDVAAYQDYQGKKQSAIWLPDETSAKAWQAYLRTP